MEQGIERTLDLAALVEQLRLHGFRVDTRQYLSAHDLLLASAARGKRLEDDPRALRTYLGPIFCTSPEEQVRFAEVMATWTAAPPSLEAPKPQQEKDRAPKPFVAWKRRAWLLPAAALVIAAGTVGAFVHHRRIVPIAIAGHVTTTDGKGEKRPAPAARVSLDGRELPVDSSGVFRVSLARRDGSRTLSARLQGFVPEERTIDAETAAPIELELVPPRAPVSTSKLHIGSPIVVRPAPSGRTSGKLEHRVRRSWVAIAALGVAILTYVLLWLAHTLRRRLVLRRLPVKDRPDFATLSNRALPSPWSEREQKRLTTVLRRPREEDVSELDLLDSVEATARGGGFFSPVYATRRTIPEYLALVRRENPADHEAHLADALLNGLRDRGLAVERYFFHDDPRICTMGEPPFAARTVHELLARHYRATLLLFLDADACFHPITGRMRAWVEAFHALPRRILLTSAAPYEWGRAQWELARDGFIVLPATMEGLLSYAEVEGDWRIERFFPAPYSRPFPSMIATEPWRWLDRNAPPKESVEKMLRELRGFLGKEGFAWLAACAVYPEIAWPLTLELAGTVNDRRLASLARLPWFRHGFMPDWLRRVLIAHLPEADERRVRLALERRLEALARDTLERGSQATDRALRVGGYVNALDVVRTSATDSPMQDAVFVGFISGARPDPTLVEAPGIFRRLFRRIGSFEDDLSIPVARAGAGSRLRRFFTSIRSAFIRHPNAGRLLGSTAAAALLLPIFRAPLTETIAPPTERQVEAIAFNSASTILAVAFSDGDVHLLDASTGETIGTPMLHDGSVNDVQFSPDGNVLATASQDRTARLWDIRSSYAIGEPMAHDGSVRTVRFDRDGTHLVTASEDVADVWDARTGRLLSSIKGSFNSAEFSPDGTQILSGNNRGASLWSTAEYTTEPERFQDSGNVFARFSRDGRWIFTLDREKRTARAWEASTKRMAGVQENVDVLEPGPDGRDVLLISWTDGQAWVASSDFGSVLDRPIVPPPLTLGSSGSPQRGSRADGQLSPDGQWLVLASDRAEPSFWDLSARAPLGDPLPSNERPLRAIEISPDAKLLAVAGGDAVSIWPLQEPEASQLAILEFVASPAQIAAGQRARLCVQLQGAFGAVIDPGVEFTVGDSPGSGDFVNGVRRCIEVQPTRTTQYTLRAYRRGGQSVSRSTTVTLTETRTRQGWCCVSRRASRKEQNAPLTRGEVTRSSEDACKKMGGRFAGNEKEAAMLCYQSSGAKAK